METFDMRKSILFSGLTVAEYGGLVTFLQPETIHLKGEEVLLMDGAVTDRVCFVVDGWLQAARYDIEGRGDLLALFSPGEVLCLDLVCTATRKSPFQISSIKASRLLSFAYDRLWDPEVPEPVKTRLRENIIRLLANENVRKLYKINVLYKRSLRTRIMVFLRQMYDKAGGTSFDIHMNRERFAQYLGVNRSALSHELSLMRTEGILAFRKGHFEILKPDALLVRDP